jgi:hypothetical protein
MFFGGKPVMKTTLGMSQEQELSDGDFHAYQSFILATMAACGRETQDWHRDYGPFRDLLHLSYTGDDFWPLLKRKFDQDGMLPVFRPAGELWLRCLIAFSQGGVRRTDWIEFKHPRDYADGTAAWATAPVPPVPPVTHEVVEGPNGEGVTLVYRTVEEREAQIAAYLDAAYLDAAGGSGATVPRSDSDEVVEDANDQQLIREFRTAAQREAATVAGEGNDSDSTVERKDDEASEEGAEDCSLCMDRPVDVALDCGHALCKICLLKLHGPLCPLCRRATVESAQMAVLLPAAEFARMCMKVDIMPLTSVHFIVTRFPAELECARSIWNRIELGEELTLIQDGVFEMRVEKFREGGNDDDGGGGHMGLCMRIMGNMSPTPESTFRWVTQYERKTHSQASTSDAHGTVAVYNALIEAARQLRMLALGVRCPCESVAATDRKRCWVCAFGSAESD